MNQNQHYSENQQDNYNEQWVEDKLSFDRKQFTILANQFAALPMVIFEDIRSGKLNTRDVCLYAHLIVKQGVNRTLYWGIDRLAKLTGTSETTVKASIRRLEATGHIARLRGTATTHTVCLTRLDPSKGSNRILVKEKALIPPHWKTGVKFKGGKSATAQASKSYGSCSNGDSIHVKRRAAEQDERSDFEREMDELLASEGAEF